MESKNGNGRVNLNEITDKKYTIKLPTLEQVLEFNPQQNILALLKEVKSQAIRDDIVLQVIGLLNDLRPALSDCGLDLSSLLNHEGYEKVSEIFGSIIRDRPPHLLYVLASYLKNGHVKEFLILLIFL